MQLVAQHLTFFRVVSGRIPFPRKTSPSAVRNEGDLVLAVGFNDFEVDATLQRPSKKLVSEPRTDFMAV